MAPARSASAIPGVSPKAELHGLFERLAPHFAALDAFLDSQLDAFEPEIRDLARYCIGSGGKRIRPALVFFSGWRDDGRVDEALVRVAAVIEMVHLATLVHDDIMDKADLRRGHRTAAREFGPETAVLLGDALFAHALHVAAGFPTTEVCRRVAASTRRVCTGEILQTLATVETIRDRARYQRIIDLKTAELFAVSCFLGARLGGVGETVAAGAEAFGRRLGTAYQIYDDLSDLFAAEADAGKTLGTDLASGKSTLPVLLLLDRLPEDEASAFREEIRRGDTGGFDRRIAQMCSLGIVEDVLQAIRSEIADGQARLGTDLPAGACALLGRLGEVLERQAAELGRR